MSDYIKPNYTKQRLDLQNVNTYVAVHDLTCNCEHPLQHIITQIIKQEPSIKKWVATTIAESGDQDTEKDIDHFGPGELEALFAQDNAEDAEG